MRKLTLAVALFVSLLMSWNTVAWAALETRFGIVEFRITVFNKTAYAGPLRCGADIEPGYRMIGTSYAMARQDRNITTSITASNSSIVCTVRIAYNWTFVDPAKLIDASIKIDSYTCTCGNNSFYYSLDIADQVYPTNGTVRIVYATIDI